VGRSRSFEKRAREEVERIKAEEAAEEERKQARMRELAEQARKRREAEAAEEERRKEGRDAKLRRSQEEKAEVEERLARCSASRSWKASGGTEAAFDEAWTSMWEEMLKRRTIDADRWAREVMHKALLTLPTQARRNPRGKHSYRLRTTNRATAPLISNSPIAGARRARPPVSGSDLAEIVSGIAVRSPLP
jgi:hypothetical protein